MSWTPEVYIGELRPWPESVRVVRGNSGEVMRYDRSERSNNGAEWSSDGVDVTCVPDDYTAKLMAEVERLEDENDKLREQLDTAEHNRKRNFREYARLCHENDKLRKLVDELWALAYGYVPDESELDAARDMMHELGIEVGE